MEYDEGRETECTVSGEIQRYLHTKFALQTTPLVCQPIGLGNQNAPSFLLHVLHASTNGGEETAAQITQREKGPFPEVERGEGPTL